MIGAFFRDLTGCLTMAVAVTLGIYLAYGTAFCDKILARGNSKGCDKWRKAMFAGALSLVLLIVLKVLLGMARGRGGGANDGY